jgi:high-affinity Fe2+/Pb2+ permease
MRRTLLWLLLLCAAVAYGLVVYSWWVEGNSNQRQWQVQQEMEDAKVMHRAQSL